MKKFEFLGVSRATRRRHFRTSSTGDENGFWLEIRNKLNHTENAKFKHNDNKLYLNGGQKEFGLRVAESKFLANTLSTDRRNSRRK